MKNLKKNQLKLDKEVVASLSGVELSKVVGGGTLNLCNTVLLDCKPQSVNICEPISINHPCIETDTCVQTKYGKPCLVSQEGGMSKCFCPVETNLNC